MRAMQSVRQTAASRLPGCALSQEENEALMRRFAAAVAAGAVASLEILLAPDVLEHAVR